MQHFTRSALVVEGPLFQVPALASAVVVQDLAPEYFHRKWRAGLYKPYTDGDGDFFGKCELHGNKRLLTALPCKYKDKTLLVPFLVDTGCPITMLHTSAFDKFGSSDRGTAAATAAGTTVKHSIIVAGCGLEAQENTLTDTDAVVSDLNILGMDFIQRAAPDVLDYFSLKFRELRPRIGPVWVTVDGAVMKVTPKENTVFDL
jgi:predicted aspartyl protease